MNPARAPQSFPFLSLPADLQGEVIVRFPNDIRTLCSAVCTCKTMQLVARARRDFLFAELGLELLFVGRRRPDDSAGFDKLLINLFGLNVGGSGIRLRVVGISGHLPSLSPDVARLCMRAIFREAYRLPESSVELKQLSMNGALQTLDKAHYRDDEGADPPGFVPCGPEEKVAAAIFYTRNAYGRSLFNLKNLVRAFEWAEGEPDQDKRWQLQGDAAHAIAEFRTTCLWNLHNIPPLGETFAACLRGFLNELVVFIPGKAPAFQAKLLNVASNLDVFQPDMVAQVANLASQLLKQSDGVLSQCWLDVCVEMAWIARRPGHEQIKQEVKDRAQAFAPELREQALAVVSQVRW